MKKNTKTTVWNVKKFKEITDEKELRKIEGGTLNSLNSSIIKVLKKLFG